MSSSRPTQSPLPNSHNSVLSQRSHSRVPSSSRNGTPNSHPSSKTSSSTLPEVSLEEQLHRLKDLKQKKAEEVKEKKARLKSILASRPSSSTSSPSYILALREARLRNTSLPPEWPLILSTSSQLASINAIQDLKKRIQEYEELEPLEHRREEERKEELDKLKTLVEEVKKIDRLLKERKEKLLNGNGGTISAEEEISIIVQEKEQVNSLISKVMMDLSSFIDRMGREALESDEEDIPPESILVFLSPSTKLPESTRIEIVNSECFKLKQLLEKLLCRSFDNPRDPWVTILPPLARLAEEEEDQIEENQIRADRAWIEFLLRAGVIFPHPKNENKIKLTEYGRLPEWGLEGNDIKK